MSTLFKFIISNSNNEYFGNSSLGFPITGAVAKGLTYTGGTLPGWQLAQQVAPGGFDANYYRYNPSTNTSTFIAPESNVVTGTSVGDYIATFAPYGAGTFNNLEGVVPPTFSLEQLLFVCLEGVMNFELRTRQTV